MRFFMTTKVLVAIYDYPRGDLADLEVRLALRNELPGWSIESASVPSFKTLSTGFVIAQSALSEFADKIARENFLVYANCAPRKDSDQSRKNNDGEGLVYAELTNGTRVIAVNSGYSLAFVRNEIQRLSQIQVNTDGSQFRSRDNFPKVIGRFAAEGLPGYLIKKDLDPLKAIPDIPACKVAYVDSFGNLKLTLRAQDPMYKNLTLGQKVRIKIGCSPRTAIVTDGSFNILEGELALSPGSSGFDNRFVEIFLRGGSAQALFGADAEDDVQIIVPQIHVHP
jgi:hypothetical protein